ncbi:hypothetical protein AB833_32615 [Chromatiales bacterium (ex Bugula neritina AB1)]|nr:hypothetical protein AB833_32615 [Chromatiales bacterium (ex Bugula neritina AB1)]
MKGKLLSKVWPGCFIRLFAAFMAATASCLTMAAEVGLMQWSFKYYDENVPVSVWFPTTHAAIDINAGPFTPRAATGVAVQQREHPLVIISHGTGGSGIAHHTIAEALASGGYLVAAMNHPGDNYQDRSLVADERYFIERPRQIQAMLHAITSDEKLASVIDQSRIGAIGHSAGGYAVAVALGAQPDRKGLIEHCSKTGDDPSCRYRDPALGVTSPRGQPFTLPAETTPLNYAADSKIRSAVLMAPLGSVISAASRINPDVPVRIIVAESDEILPHQYHLARLEKVAPHATTQLVPGAGHFSFISPVNEQWRDQLGEVAIDPPGFDRVEFHRTLGRDLREWFDESLKRVIYETVNR